MKLPKQENRLRSSGEKLDKNDCKVTLPKTTGRWMVVFREDAVNEGLQRLESLGLQALISTPSSTKGADEIVNQGFVFFKTLGVALVTAPAEKINRLLQAAGEPNSPIVTVEQEKIRRALESRKVGLASKTLGDRELSSDVRETIAFDESEYTWGLQVTSVVDSTFSGRGIRVAILDTGLDLELNAGGEIIYHPDFVGRTIEGSSFLPVVKIVKDGDSHGTHCTGTACGPLKPSTTRRYGIAFGADIFVGKVLDDRGDGEDGWIIAGIQWAISKRCHIVSIAHGWEKEPDAPYSETYENIARRALKLGTLIMAAAGNDSLRPFRVCPISEPAGCASIMAVGAVDSQLQVAEFSNGGINATSRGIDIAAPGDIIYSSYPMPKRYGVKMGTSMAVSHVAGIAALYAEANPGVLGKALWSLITNNACALPFPPQDVGAGLVKAP